MNSVSAQVVDQPPFVIWAAGGRLQAAEGSRHHQRKAGRQQAQLAEGRTRLRTQCGFVLHGAFNPAVVQSCNKTQHNLGNFWLRLPLSSSTPPGYGWAAAPLPGPLLTPSSTATHLASSCMLLSLFSASRSIHKTLSGCHNLSTSAVDDDLGSFFSCKFNRAKFEVEKAVYIVYRQHPGNRRGRLQVYCVQYCVPVLHLAVQRPLTGTLPTHSSGQEPAPPSSEGSGRPAQTAPGQHRKTGDIQAGVEASLFKRHAKCIQAHAVARAERLSQTLRHVCVKYRGQHAMCSAQLHL